MPSPEIALSRRRLMAASASSATLAAAPVGIATPSPGAPRIMATGLAFPEGPIAFADGSAMCVEIAGGSLTRIAPDGGKTLVAHLGGGPNGAAIGPDGACYVANNGGLTFASQNGLMLPVGVPADFKNGSIQRVDLASGAVQTLYTHVAGNPLKGPNDLVFDRFGGLWFTDTGKIYPRTRDQGGLYWARPDGTEVREIVYPLTTPNGIALSPDRQILYVALSMTRQIVSFRIEGPGQLTQRRGRPDMTMVASLGGNFILDSMCVQADGTLVVGAVLTGQLLRIRPDGSMLAPIGLPDIAVTNAAFGGPDLQTLFVTLSQSGRIATLRWPSPGLKLLYR